MGSMGRAEAAFLTLLALLAPSCKKQEGTGTSTSAGSVRVGLVTDVGGRGDHSFNDSALRGLELWAAGKKVATGGYRSVSPEEFQRSIPAELASHRPPIEPLPITPIVLQSKAQEDYEPNLQLLADEGVSLIIGVGFMMENAVNVVARRNPNAK